MSEPIWNRRIGYGERLAVLVVDMMRAFTEPHRDMGSDFSESIHAINQLTEAARQNDVPVFFAAIVYHEHDYSDAGLWRLKVGGQEDLRAGGDGIEIDPRLTRTERDGYLVKKYPSCFFGTDLASRLVSSGIDTLVLAGCSTSGCVRATAVDAIQYGFRPIVAKEAVCDRWEAAHQQALSDLDAKYADVVPTHEVVARLNRG